MVDSSWSKNGIRVTYSQVRAAIIGDGAPRYHRRGFGLFDGFGGFGGFFHDEPPVYQRFLSENVPDSPSLAINGKIYTYQQGPVSPELASALASAAPGNVKIRLLWQDGKTKDTEIGKETVRAWKAVFNPS